VIHRSLTAALGLVPGLVCLLAGLAVPIHAEEPAPGTSSVIHLTNGDFVTGQLVDSNEPVLTWQSPAFRTPFQFPIPSVASIQFFVPDKLVQPKGAYCIELAAGDVLYGSLIGLQGQEAVLETVEFGQLHLDRSLLRRMYRWHGGDELLFHGPSGLKGWQIIGGNNSWREEAGNLISDKPNAIVRRDFGLPAQSRIEFELSWKTKADFELTVGMSDAKTAQRAYRFEVWENHLVVQRETEKEADLASIKPIKPGPGRIHLQAFLDQTKGRMLVFSSSGKQVADLTVVGDKSRTYESLQLSNKSGDVRLERLTIGRWNGDLPRSVDADKSRIHGTDGSIAYGQLQSFDPEKREFVIDNNGKEERFAENRIQDVYFSEENAVAKRSVRAMQLTGQRVSGDLIRVEQNTIVLKSPGIREELRLPLVSLQTILSSDANTPVTGADPAAPASFTGQMELTGTSLRGNLAESTGGANEGLMWKPSLSSVASPLKPGIAAKIVYRTPPPKPATATSTTTRQVRIVGQAGVAVQVQSIATEASPDSPPKAKPPKKTILHLRSGDTLPCDAVSINENGVTFASTVSDATFIPHDKLKVLELIPNAPPVQIPKSKRERLLILPRMQRDNPPTHLIRSVDGDYLRGRIVSMDEQQIQVEIRLEEKTLHRDRVARIIWLHADELDPKPKDGQESAAAEEEGVRVQALTGQREVTPVADQAGETVPRNPTANSNRLTFVAKSISGTVLSGHSELLGGCRVELREIDQLLIGPAIEQDAASLAFHQWRMKSAVDPIAARDEPDSGGASEGQDAALVGKMAPDFELDLLDGSKFRLADQRNKVIVLDFWASWCGPCLQVMPQVDKVAHEFADQGVELYAVNLEETEDRIQAALDRLKLTTKVALDRNGRIAEKYGAVSIPQTVIIDRNGKVVRLFIGGGARFGDQLREALTAVLAENMDKTE
jgi:thiol-disulfide isomerase/thioredoxin